MCFYIQVGWLLRKNGNEQSRLCIFPQADTWEGPEGVRLIEVLLHVRHCVFTLSVKLRSALFLGSLSELKCEKSN